MTIEKNHKDFLPVKDADTELGIAKKTLQNWIYAKKIPVKAISIGRINKKIFINVKMVKGL